MVLVERSVDVYSLRSDQLGLTLCHTGDRWQHELSAPCAGNWQTLFSSDESDQAGVPSSPALQDLRLEQLSEQVLEFQLLGQAAKGIYSAAIRFDGRSHAIEFDFCARAPNAGTRLCTASRYLAGKTDLGVESRPGGGLILRAPGARAVELVPLATEGAPGDKCRLLGCEPIPSFAAGHFREDEPAVRPASIRWRYRVECI